MIKSLMADGIGPMQNDGGSGAAAPVRERQKREPTC